MLPPVVFNTVVLPLAMLWRACSSPFGMALRSVPPRIPTCMACSPDIDMSGRVVIVTGANTGIGNRTAFHLARMGAKVVMACRSVERGEKARAEIEQEIRVLSSPTQARSSVEPGTSVFGTGSLEVMQCDLGDLRSVRDFARRFEAKHNGELDVLVNNAGLLGFGKTTDGLDETFGVNFVGHFALTLELMPIIQSRGVRVVCLTSSMHHFGCTDWGSAVGGHKKHPNRSTYSDSKLAMLLFAKELRRRFSAAGSSATAFSVHPGAVSSDIWRFIPKSVMPAYKLFMCLFYLDVEQGSRTPVCASTLPLENLAGSDYYQPYWLPFGWKLPFEIFGPFVGCAPGRPSLPDNEPAASAEMWAACERIIEVAGTARGSSAVAARS